MSDTTDPMLQLLGRPDGPLAGASLWSLEVVSAGPLTPRMRRVELTGEHLAELDHQPGQDLMLRIPVDGGTVNRRYTIRRADRARAVVTIDAVAHGDGPGARWLADAKRGSRLDAVGPRGKILLADDVSWHLFAGDESALPAMLAMAEAVPAGSRAIVLAEVVDARDEQPLTTAATVDVRWLHRGDTEAGRSSVLVDALTELPLPEGSGHAYLAGEAQVVTSLRKVLLNRWMPAERISAKAYWSLGRANASHGEPAKDAGGL